MFRILQEKCRYKHILSDNCLINSTHTGTKEVISWKNIEENPVLFLSLFCSYLCFAPIFVLLLSLLCFYLCFAPIFVLFRSLFCSDLCFVPIFVLLLSLFCSYLKFFLSFIPDLFLVTWSLRILLTLVLAASVFDL